MAVLPTRLTGLAAAIALVGVAAVAACADDPDPAGGDDVAGDSSENGPGASNMGDSASPDARSAAPAVGGGSSGDASMHSPGADRSVAQDASAAGDAGPEAASTADAGAGGVDGMDAGAEAGAEAGFPGVAFEGPVVCGAAPCTAPEVCCVAGGLLFGTREPHEFRCMAPAQCEQAGDHAAACLSDANCEAGLRCCGQAPALGGASAAQCRPACLDDEIHLQCAHSAQCGAAASCCGLFDVGYREVLCRDDCAFDAGGGRERYTLCADAADCVDARVQSIPASECLWNDFLRGYRVCREPSTPAEAPLYGSCPQDNCSDDHLCMEAPSGTLCTTACDVPEDCTAHPEGASVSCIQATGADLAFCLIGCTPGTPGTCPDGMLCSEDPSLQTPACLWP